MVMCRVTDSKLACAAAGDDMASRGSALQNNGPIFSASQMLASANMRTDPLAQANLAALLKNNAQQL